MNENAEPSSSASHSGRERNKKVFSSFIPLLLILLILNLNILREVVNLYHHRSAVRAVNAQSAARMKLVGEKGALVEKLRANIIQMAENDPAAAQLKADFFPPTVSRSLADKPLPAPTSAPSAVPLPTPKTVAP